MNRFVSPALILFLPALLHGNGGGYITGVKSTGAFLPIGIDQVEMLSERLEIDLHIEYADIRIEYVLHNPGKKVKVEAGFPSAIATRTEDRGGKGGAALKAAPKLKDFSLTVDGKTVKVTQTDDQLDLSKPDMYMFSGKVVNSWHRVKMDFAEGQTRKVAVRYRNPYFYSTFDVSDNGSTDALSLTYLFSAAGAWKGPIGHGIVNVKNISIPESQISFSHPKRFVKSHNVWTWSFTDFEPTLEDDLTIVTRPSFDFHPAVKTTSEDTIYMGYYHGYGTRRDPKTGQHSGGRWEFHRHDFTATASSNLPDADGQSYQPSAVNDRDWRSAWTEGANGHGVGEWLLLTLDKPSPAHRLGIVPGYTKSAELYAANGRPAELDVSVNGGNPVRVKLPDEHLKNETYIFDLPSKGELVKTIKLTLAKVYPGSSYEDTAISKIVLIQPLSKAPKIEPAR